MSRIRSHFVQFASYDFSAKNPQKCKKGSWLPKVFPHLLENDNGDRFQATHRRVARRTENCPLHPRSCATSAQGGQKHEILSAGRLLKFLIIFSFNFSNNSLKLQLIKEIKQTIIKHMVEEEKNAKKVKPEKLMSRFRS